VAAFLGAQGKLGRAPNTLNRRLAAIQLMHRGARVAVPTDAIEVVETVRGLRRDWGKPPARKAPALDEDVQHMVDTIDLRTLQGLRDRAVLLVGFAGGLRRSELVAIDVEDFTVRPEGLELVIRRSKGDQEGQGQIVTFPKLTLLPRACAGGLLGGVGNPYGCGVQTVLWA
jgi:site-specific recombinase XerD